MATLTIFDEFVGDVGKGLHLLNSHSFKAMLTNTAPVKDTNAVKADITEIAAGNGYAAGGFAMTVTWAETGAGLGIWRFQSTVDPNWTASGGDIATHRYLVVYNDTQGAPVKPLVGYVDRGSSDILANGNTRAWDIGASGMFEMDATP